MAVVALIVAAVVAFTRLPRSGGEVATPAAEAREVPQIEDLAALDPSLRVAVEEKVSAVRLDPTRGDAYGELGRLYHAHGYFALARRSYEIAQGLTPGEAAWPYYLGVFASGRGQTGEAIESLRRALALDSRYLPTYLRLGNLLLADGQLDEAEEMYSTLVDRAAEDPWGYLGRGKVARRHGRLEEAAAMLEQAVARAPDDREGVYLLAMTYRELGRTEPARRQLEAIDSKARAWPPDPLMEHIRTGRRDLQALIRRANELLAQGDAEGAEGLYRSVLDADPAHFDALHNLGVVYARQGRLAEAEASLEAAVASRPDRADAHFALATVYANRGHYEKVDAELEAVLRLDPEHAEARSLLAARRR